MPIVTQLLGHAVVELARDAVALLAEELPPAGLLQPPQGSLELGATALELRGPALVLLEERSVVQCDAGVVGERDQNRDIARRDLDIVGKSHHQDPCQLAVHGHRSCRRGARLAAELDPFRFVDEHWPPGGNRLLGERGQRRWRHLPALDDGVARVDDDARHPPGRVCAGEHHRRPARVEVVGSRLDDGVAHGDGPRRRCAQRRGDPLERFDRVVEASRLVAPGGIETRLGRADADQALERPTIDAVAPLSRRRRRSGGHRPP